LQSTSSESLPTPSRAGDPITRFRPQSTWLLLFLAFITFGVYYGHYTLRQTRALSPCLPEDKGRRLLAASYRVLIMGYASLVPVAALWLLPLSAGTAAVIGMLGNAWLLLWLLMHSVWSVMFRTRLNAYYGFQPGSPDWFHGFWSFFFPSLYVNYKINRIVERRPF